MVILRPLANHKKGLLPDFALKLSSYNLPHIKECKMTCVQLCTNLSVTMLVFGHVGTMTAGNKSVITLSYFLNFYPENELSVL